jgi:hypothetical protein
MCGHRLRVCRSQHHLVVVGAQECNYTKDARISRKRGEKQERAFSVSAANGAREADAAAAAEAAADPEADPGTGNKPQQQQQQQQQRRHWLLCTRIC